MNTLHGISVSHAKGKLHQSLYPPHENTMIEISVRKRHQINEEVGNLERPKDGSNKMRDKTKNLTTEIILILPLL